MKSFAWLFILLLVLSLINLSCQNSEIQDMVPGIIPNPQEIVKGKGYFKSAGDLQIINTDPRLVPVLSTFKKQLDGRIDVLLSANEKGNVQVQLIDNGNIGEESYSLEVGRKLITIKASSEKGVFYGLQSLRQLFNAGERDPMIKIPRCSITDSPRFSWRGVMIDESRHFFGMNKIKQLLDIMSLHKLNVLHWHLTDSPGWRVEIKQYPKLTEVGGTGNHTDSKAPAAFYTQSEIKEIISYASERFITIIPEIDMPGHATAANRSYPEYSGGGSERYPDFTFNPGKEGTYVFLTNILREISELFPSKYIHIGGDEVNYGNQQWPNIPDVRKMMEKESLSDLKAVETYFNKRIRDSISALGKMVVGWDEIVDTRLDPETSIAMWWRHDKTDQLLKALENNYQVVLCPRIPLYFDFVQHESHKDGRKWRNIFCPLESVYQFPPDTLPGYFEHEKQILGIQANLWTERIHSEARFDFMLYPRISALAEAAWTNQENKSYADFTERLKAMLSYYDELKIKYFNPFDPGSTPEPEPAKKLNP